MKLPRPGKSRAAETVPASENAAPESQRLCPQCGATISSRAKTCVYCGADLVAIAQAEEAQAKAIEREKRTEAAQRPTLVIAILFTAIVVVLIVAIMIQGSRQQAIAALTPTITRAPTRTPVLPTATPRATATPTGTPTPVPPLEYTVKNGDTPGRVALLYDVTVPELMSFNGKAEDDVIMVGEVLKIPPPTPEPIDTATPAPGTPTPNTVNEIVYTVQEGDTLSGIARDKHVPLEVLQRVNNFPDPSKLQVGQQIIIPLNPTITFTPGPGVSSEADVTPTPVSMYPPVTLLTPLDREIFIGNSMPILLQWLSSGILQPNELYRVEVERPGATPISFRTRATSYHVLTDQYPAPGDPDRVFKWSVAIVRQTSTGENGAPTYTVVSPKSSYSFEWLESLPTPTPTSTLGPGQRPAVEPSKTPTPTS